MAKVTNRVSLGSYGFGLERPPAQSDADAEFILYNQAGKKVAQCAAKKDTHLEHPTPLQVVMKGQKTALLYLGRYIVEINP